MKRSFYPILLMFIILSVVLLSTSLVSHEPNTNDTQEKEIRQLNCAVNLPDAVDFAGEKVPLDDIDVSERLDRELHVNTFYHSSSFQIFKLANRYFPLIESILDKNGIPGDFKYLAAAESALRNNTSPAGAKGYWQFMPATARAYGLEVTSEIDQRLDITKSTEAACRYILDAYKELNNWTLTAASYNMGNGGIKTQMEKQQADNYYDLYLNTETSRYIFRILALKLIISNPSDYGFCFEEDDLYQPLRFKTVEINETIDNLATFAKSHNTTYKMLKYLNPWLLKNSLTVKPGQEYAINLPA